MLDYHWWRLLLLIKCARIILGLLDLHWLRELAPISLKSLIFWSGVKGLSNFFWWEQIVTTGRSNAYWGLIELTDCSIHVVIDIIVYLLSSWVSLTTANAAVIDIDTRLMRALYIVVMIRTQSCWLLVTTLIASMLNIVICWKGALSSSGILSMALRVITYLHFHCNIVNG